MKRELVAGLIGLVLGGATVFLVLRAATQRYEERVQRAETAADMLQADADAAQALADSLAGLRPDTVRVPAPVTRTDVQTIIETLPDSQAVEELVRIVAERDTAIAERDTSLRLADAEIAALRVSNRHLRAALDTTRAALADRPSAVVTWDWRPKLNGYVFGRYESGTTCLGAGPGLSIWRIAVTGYVAGCSVPVTVRLPSDPGIEARFGIQGSVRMF